jgi:hypothetical protein
MTNEIAKVEDEFLVLSKDVDKVKTVVEANLGGEDGASMFDLEQVKMPTGGGKSFILSDGSAVESIEAVICQWQNIRAYWPGDYSGGDKPQCSSTDGVTGKGNPGGLCRECPYAQFGSAEKGEGQACKAMRRLFLLKKDRVLPMLLTLPPTSIKPCRKYLTRITSQMLPYWQVVTEFTCHLEENASNIKYAVVDFSLAGTLSDEQSELIQEYAESLGALLDAPVTREEYIDNDEPVEL